MLRRLLLGLSAIGLLATLAYGQGGNTVYGITGVAGAASSLYTINISTGAGTLVGATGVNGVGSLAFSPGGVLYGVANASTLPVTVASPQSGRTPRLIQVPARTLITLNTSTGAATAVGATGANSNFTDIAFRSDGALFGMTGNGQLYTINTTTAVATPVGSAQGGPTGGGLAFNSADILYLADQNQLFTVNQTTGVRTLASAINFSAFSNPGSSRISGMKFHPASGVLYTAVLVQFLDPFGSVNLSNGVVNNIGDPGVLLEAIAISGSAQAPPPPSSVPVPSSLLMLGTGLAAAGLWMFWRRRAQRAS